MLRATLQTLGVTPFAVFLRGTKGVKILQGLTPQERAARIQDIYRNLSPENMEKLRQQAALMPTPKRTFKGRKVGQVKVSRYAQFLKANIDRFKHLPSSRERVKAIAELWKEEKTTFTGSDNVDTDNAGGGDEKTMREDRKSDAEVIMAGALKKRRKRRSRQAEEEQPPPTAVVVTKKNKFKKGKHQATIKEAPAEKPVKKLKKGKKKLNPYAKFLRDNIHRFKHLKGHGPRVKALAQLWRERKENADDGAKKKSNHTK